MLRVRFFLEKSAKKHVFERIPPSRLCRVLLIVVYSYFDLFLHTGNLYQYFFDRNSVCFCLKNSE